MDKQQFIQQYVNDTNKRSTMDIVYNEFVRYCREHNITEDDLTTEELEEIAQHVTRNGLNP